MNRLIKMNRNNIIEKLLVLFIVVYPISFIWQGLDFTDMGYSLTNYQLIFSSPEDMVRGFNSWLTNVIGGTSLLLFNDFGVIGARFSAVLVFWATTYFVYLTLKPYIDRTILLLSLLVSLILIERVFWINYNNLTALFFVIAIYFLIKGLRADKNIWLLIAGIIIAMNVYIRFPNITGISLLFTVFIYGRFIRARLQKQLKWFFTVLLGVIIGAIIPLAIMSLMGHFHLYWDTVSLLWDSLTEKSSANHTASSLLSTYIGQFYTIVKYALLLLIIFIGIATVNKKKDRTILMNCVYFILILGSLVLIFDHASGQRDTFLSLITAQIILTNVWLTFKKDNKEMSFISLLSLFILLFVPLGSDIGVRNAGYGMHLAYPVSLSFLLRKQYLQKLTIRNLLLVVNILFIFITLIYGTVSAYQYTYRDTDVRTDMIYQVSHPKLKWVFTTETRAKTIQDLLNNLSEFIEPGDYLFAYEAIPLVYYLTDTKPYLFSAWPMLNEPIEFEEILKRAELERSELPVVVRPKGRTTSFYWPHDAGLITNPRYIKDRVIINNFLEKNKYTQIWENNFFEILISKK